MLQKDKKAFKAYIYRNKGFFVRIVGANFYTFLQKFDNYVIKNVNETEGYVFLKSQLIPEVSSVEIWETYR